MKLIEETTCCFLGHREINATEELKQQLYSVIEYLIKNKKVNTFLFGSKSQFNDLCQKCVTKIKEKYPHIKRNYVRSELPQIDENYKNYLLESYEDTYYPQAILHAGKAVYIKRNCEMVNKSSFCIVYYQEDYTPKSRKSGTKNALNYAIKKKKQIIILPLKI